jgi:hypothetical protein
MKKTIFEIEQELIHFGFNIDYYSSVSCTYTLKNEYKNVVKYGHYYIHYRYSAFNFEKKPMFSLGLEQKITIFQTDDLNELIKFIFFYKF